MSVATFASLDPASYREIVRRALAEDVRWGDITAEVVIPTGLQTAGALVLGARCVLAGLDVAAECFRQVDPHVGVEMVRRDGERCEAGAEVVRVSGSAAAVLTAERTAVNFLRRLTTLATLTRQLVDAGRGRVTVRDTGNTTPTLRAIEQYAVRVGGGVSHRIGLDDGVLISQNHVRLAGSVRAAVERARRTNTEMPIEVVICAIDEIEAAIAGGAAVLHVDGAAGDLVREAVVRSRGRAKVSLAGPVSVDRMAQAADVGAEYASLDVWMHAAPRVQVALKLTCARG
jgi:nicotinate-nucleotide pyrophosphorylase (carboxylating)